MTFINDINKKLVYYPVVYPSPRALHFLDPIKPPLSGHITTISQLFKFSKRFSISKHSNMIYSIKRLLAQHLLNKPPFANVHDTLYKLYIKSRAVIILLIT